MDIRRDVPEMDNIVILYMLVLAAFRSLINTVVFCIYFKINFRTPSRYTAFCFFCDRHIG